jgi:hypothetical protein
MRLNRVRGVPRAGVEGGNRLIVISARSAQATRGGPSAHSERTRSSPPSSSDATRHDADVGAARGNHVEDVAAGERGFRAGRQRRRARREIRRHAQAFERLRARRNPG